MGVHTHDGVQKIWWLWYKFKEKRSAAFKTITKDNVHRSDLGYTASSVIISATMS